MNPFRADLHCHTTCSDGTLNPTQLIQLAVEKGLSGLSITDHDTVAAYPEAILTAHVHSLPLLTGVELSAVCQKKSVHLLAYAFPLHSSVMQACCKEQCLRRRLRAEQVLHKLSTHGMPLTQADFPPSAWRHAIGRPHIAQAMMKRGYVSSLSQAFHSYLGHRKPCHVPWEGQSVEEMIDIIHAAKGLAILAHPHLIKEETLLKRLLRLPFDGIEGYYGTFPLHIQERWVSIGRQKGWLITGGSDFHGETKPLLSLGSSWVSEETFQRLWHHAQSHEETHE